MMYANITLLEFKIDLPRCFRFFLYSCSNELKLNNHFCFLNKLIISNQIKKDIYYFQNQRHT